MHLDVVGRLCGLLFLSSVLLCFPVSVFVEACIYSFLSIARICIV